MSKSLAMLSVAELKKEQSKRGIKDSDIVGSGKNGYIKREDRVKALEKAKISKDIKSKKKDHSKAPKKKRPSKVPSEEKHVSATGLSHLPSDVLNKMLMDMNPEDAINLCKTDKAIRKVCKANKKLQERLQFHAEVSAKLKEIMRHHYRDLPAWVNKDLFYKDYGNEILQSIAEGISSLLDDHRLDNNTYSKDMYHKNGSFTVQIDRHLLAFPFTSKYYEPPTHEDDVNVTSSTFTFSKKSAAYIMKHIGPELDDWHNITKITYKLLDVHDTGQ